MIEIQLHKKGIHNAVLSPNTMSRQYEKPGDLFQLTAAGVCKVYDDHRKQGLAWSRERQASFLNLPCVHGISRRPADPKVPKKISTELVTVAEAPPLEMVVSLDASPSSESESSDH